MSEHDEKTLAHAHSSQENWEREAENLVRLILEEKRRREQEDKASTPEALRRCYNEYKKKHTFREGDVVRWKQGLKDRKLPLENEAAIVVKVLDEPIFDNMNDAGSPYFRETYDVILGVIQNGDFVTYHYNSLRFEPYTD